MSISAVQIPGAVDFSTNVLKGYTHADVTGETSKFNSMDATLKVLERTKANATATIGFYIKTTYNLNNEVRVQQSVSDASDDMWAIFDVSGSLRFKGTGGSTSATKSFRVADNGNETEESPQPTITTSYNLPTFTNKVVPIKMISFQSDLSASPGSLGLPTLRFDTFNANGSVNTDISGTVNTTGATVIQNAFQFQLVLSSNDSGNITCVSALADGRIHRLKLSTTEDLNLSQAVGFSLGTSDTFLSYTNPVNSGGDILETNIVPSKIGGVDNMTPITEINALSPVTTLRDAINALYSNQNVLTSWQFTFNKQTFSDNDGNGNYINQITRHARYSDWKNEISGKTFFKSGGSTSIVTQNSTNLSLSIEGIKGMNTATVNEQSDAQTYSLFATAEPIFGVVTQTGI